MADPPHSSPELLDPTREEGPGARASEPTGRPPVAGLICLAGAVACSGAYLLILQSHLTFLEDDWAFLLNRRGSSAAVFLDPYGAHLVLAPVSIYKALLAVFGMSSVLPFAVASTLLFLLSAVLLFFYLRRRVGVWLALLGAVLILFLGADWTSLLYSFNISFFGSVAAGIGALLALERDDRWGDVLACTLLVVSNSFSEVAFAFVAAAFVSVALGPSSRLRRLYVVLVPLALYGIWYLGWGHKAPQTASFHNLVNSPKFVFDSISQNLASLFGLATPLDGETGPYVGGLNWGRILFVIAIVLAIWRLRRVGGPSRWLLAALAGGAAFWFLTALNADPIRRTPTTGRYQYQGAIFVLLIAAEFLRGVRPGKRVLAAATAVTVAAAVSGIIFLHDGYNRHKYATDLNRAMLAAVEIGRGHETHNFVVNLSILSVPFYASSYLSAVDAYGSPAFSQSQLEASNEVDREAADQVLAPAEQIKLVPVAPGADQSARGGARCRTSKGSQSGSAALALGPGSYTLRARNAPTFTSGVGVPIQAARFADAASVTLGFLDPRSPAALTIPPDKSDRPWRLYPPTAGAVTVCKLGQSPAAAKTQTSPKPTPTPALAPSASRHPLPNLVGQRLDLAERKLRGLGINFKAVGGGGKVLPIVSTKRWMVCRTMPGAGTPTGGPVALVVNYLGAC